MNIQYFELNLSTFSQTTKHFSLHLTQLLSAIFYQTSWAVTEIIKTFK